MSTISNGSLDALRWQSQSVTDKAAETNKKTLDQSDFFKLLSSQLAYQDPSKPVDNNQMVSQMTSFSTLEGISNMSEQLTSLTSVMTSNQALQASSLVGKRVLIPSNQAYVDSKNTQVNGKLSLTDATSNITIRVENASGALVKTIALPASQTSTLSGNVEFSWDGTDQNGAAVPEGTYTIKATGLVADQRQDLALASYAQVQSVSLGASGSSDVVLNLRGMGGLKLSDAIEVSS